MRPAVAILAALLLASPAAAATPKAPPRLSADPTRVDIDSSAGSGNSCDKGVDAAQSEVRVGSPIARLYAANVLPAFTAHFSCDA